MKLVGYTLISIGISLLIFVIYNLVQNKSKLLSPVPEDQGVKVIFVTPSK